MYLFKKLGLKDVKSILANVLHLQADKVIPYTSKKGLPPWFEQIEVLSSHYVIAFSTQGHILEQIIYQYNISPNNEVSFKKMHKDDY